MDDPRISLVVPVLAALSQAVENRARYDSFEARFAVGCFLNKRLRGLQFGGDEVADLVE